MNRGFPFRFFSWVLPVGLLLAAVPAVPAGASRHAPPEASGGSGPTTSDVAPGRLVQEKTGVLTTRDTLRLRLQTDIGNIRVKTQNSGQVSYRVRIETDSSQPGARKLLEQFAVSARTTPDGALIRGSVLWRTFRGRLWVDFEVNVPRNYQLDVVTHAGNIVTEDIDGRVTLFTSGGNITAGRLGASGRLETQGGHITVRDVAGDLTAITAGGHIDVGSVQGHAVLRSGGGHIRAAALQGDAELETAGGNISVQRAGDNVIATTAGGRLDFGEAAGAIRAKTGGGGIRIARVAGPTQLETTGGSIYLTKVEGAVRASTAAGSITAWFLAEGKLPGASQLECGQGDIVVYLPRELSVTIDATIERATDHRVEADPALPLKVEYVDLGPGLRGVRAAGELNGGGELLRLKTVAGNIKLALSDTALQLQERLYQMQMEQLKRRLDLQQRRLERQQERQRRLLEQELKERELGRLTDLQRKFWERWSGRIRVEAEEQRQKLVRTVRPAYPELARQAGIQGVVRLEATIGEDGKVEDAKVLSGHPVLAQPALEAVRQWRYLPTRVNGKPVSVVTIVDVEFRLP